jgi:hypothetical protein
MDKDQFWEIVSTSRKRAKGKMAQQVEVLREMLRALSPEEIVEYKRKFYECMDEAYHWDLWGAAYIIGGGCSDDGFMDFRSWLISMGKDVFEAALKDVESLVDVVDSPDVEDTFFEEFLYVPGEVYEEKTGKEMPLIEREITSEPQGEPWEEDEEGKDLRDRFPKLWEAFEET